MHGLDVPAALSKLGLSGELQSNAGLFACSAALNTPCVPLHFYGAVGAVRSLEQISSRLREEKPAELQEKQRREGVLSEEDHRVLELSQSDVMRNMVTNTSYLTLLLDLGFSLYIVRRLTKSQANKEDTVEVDSES